MKSIFGIIVVLALYGGTLLYKNSRIEAAKSVYIPTTYDLQKKSGYPVTVEQVQKGTFQDHVTISGKITRNELKSFVTSSVKSKIRTGESAHFYLEDGGKKVFGRVASVKNSPSSLTGLYEVIVRFDTKLPAKLAFIAVDIPYRSVANAVLVPRPSVSNREAQPFAFVVQNNKLVKRVVNIAGSNADYFWIKSGVAEGETILTSDSRYFAGSELVQIIKEQGEL